MKTKEEKVIYGFKGFNKDLKCRDFQYEIGKDYEHKGKVEACESGFHFCENPLGIFGYYPPSESRFAEVIGSGDVSIDGDDSKVAVSRLSIKGELKLNGLIQAGVKFIFDRVKWEDAKESNTGNRSAATNTGNQSAATNTGNQSAATNTGDYSAATNTGYRSAATNTGNYSAATVEGNNSIAIVTGYKSMARGKLGCWIVLTERDDNDDILSVRAFKVDGKEILEDTFYTLENNEPKIVE